MKEFIISLFTNKTLKLVNTQRVFALNIEQARELAKENFKPNRWQFVGAEAIQSNKLTTKNKNKNV